MCRKKLLSDDIAILKEMIQSTATVSYKGTKVTLEETSSEASSGTYSVTIHGMPDADDVIVIKVLHIDSPKGLRFNHLVGRK